MTEPNYWDVLRDDVEYFFGEKDRSGPGLEAVLTDRRFEWVIVVEPVGIEDLV